MTEDQLQAEFFKHVWNTYPKTRGLFFSVPNGGTRNKIEAMKLKATGLLAGIPDLILLWNGKAYGFELKTETGVISPNQKEIHEIWAANGICVRIIRTLAQGIEIIEKIINAKNI